MSTETAAAGSEMHMKRAEVEAVLVKAVGKFTKLSDVGYAGHKVHKTDKSAGVVIRTGESGDGAPVPYFLCSGTIRPLRAQAVVDDLMVGNLRRHEWCPAWDDSSAVEEWDAASADLRALLGARPRVRVYLERTRPMVGGLISSRCFVFAQATWEAAGKVWVVLASVDALLEGALPPAYAGLPHGTMFVSGTVAQDRPDGAGCDVSSLVQTVAGGAIPNWAVTKGVSSELTSFFTLVNKVFVSGEEQQK